MEIEKRIEKYNDGTYIEIYHKKGKPNFCHREDGPAWIGYNPDGSIDFETYWVNNKPHREDGPARIIYNKDGSIESEEYYINDNIHREDGPAYISYNKDGSIKYERYYVNDKYLTKEEWESEYGWKLQLKSTPMESIYKEQK